MTAATLTHLPMMAGGAALASVGRLAGWAFAQYMKAPLTHTGVFTVAALTVLTASNALYFQERAHPAPLFAPPPATQAPAIAETAEPSVPVRPAARRPAPQVLPSLPAVETTGSVAREADVVIGNAEVFDLQVKLKAMGHFDGAVDGYYGPQTAEAIRSFEAAQGLRPLGELNRDILDAVRNAPIVSPSAAADPPPAVPDADLAPGPRPLAVIAPLAAPEPLALAPQPPADTGAVRRPHRELPSTPQEAMNIAVDTAGEALETIIDGVQTVIMTPPADAGEDIVPPLRVVGRPVAAATTVTTAPAAMAPPPAQPAATQVAMLASTPASVATPAVTAAPTATAAASVQPANTAAVPATGSDTAPESLMPPFSVTDPEIVSSVQRGLASLGFLHGPADGVAGAATAKAIRNFEVYFNYDVTGRISPELLDLLVQNGAAI